MRARGALVTSMCVTPANFRSAFPTGQHITSTPPNPSWPAKALTCSRPKPGKIPETNPSFIILNCHPLAGLVAFQNRVAQPDFMISIFRRRVKRLLRSRATRDVGIHCAVEHLEAIGKTLRVARRIIAEAGDLFGETRAGSMR